jgi:type IV secretory pathway VirJ component
VTQRAALLVVVIALAACGAGPPPEGRDAGRLGRVELWRPRAEPSAFVVLLSDAAGWSAAWAEAAQALRARGAAVAGVDLPSYLAGLRASDDGCHYVVAELEALSQRVQRELGGGSYRSPILAGAGEGATLALAALAQAPAATLAGAVVADPAPALATKVPLCGAPSRPAAEGGFAYEPPTSAPGFVRRAPAGRDPAPRRLAAAVAEALGEAAPAASLRELPLVELPGASPGPFLAVIWSGDGGWRDLDKSIGERLAAAGVAVVGVDSLRYFWRAKTPERVAADLAEILRHYEARWGRSRVALVGYSFGAGILPFAVNRLPEAERAQIVQLTLLGLEARAPFEFHVSGWLEQAGLAPEADRDAPLVLPELLRIDPALVQCVYGEEERDSLCRAPELSAVERIHTSGGHHFDGDYDALAARILAGLERRAAARPGASAAAGAAP